MKIFTSAQIRELDLYTIEHEPVKSVDLMERAALALFHELTEQYPAPVRFCILAGPGNNGGDALALARLLRDATRIVRVFLFSNDNLSDDCNFNRIKLRDGYPDVLTEIQHELIRPDLEKDEIVIDGLFGSGLNRPLSGIWSQLVQFINQSGNEIVSIDVPSGLNADSVHHFSEPTIRATYTYSFQFPKLAFFHAENEKYTGKWKILDIAIHPKGIAELDTSYELVDVELIKRFYRKRPVFSHKGTFGHLGVLAGAKGMAGASILAVRAALRTGIGLITIHGPESNRNILQNAVPEAIFEVDKNPECITEFYHIDRYDALAIGPGIGTRTVTVEMMDYLLKHIRIPVVFDADALNIIASHEHMMKLLPPGSILTPHPGEFDRLCGASVHSQERLEKAIDLAQKNRIYIVLKGAYTKIVCPEGKIYFNSTGNPGMATAGSGDVLTGIIGSLLAQEYAPEQAAVMGVFLHGLAGDLALNTQSEESLMAGDIVEHIGKAYKIMY